LIPNNFARVLVFSQTDKDRCRSRSSRVHSVYLTWQTIAGLTQRQRLISAAFNPWFHRLRPGAGRLSNGQLSTRIFCNSSKSERRSFSLNPGPTARRTLALAFVKANEQRAETFPRPFGFGISANHEFLLLVELDLDPCPGAFPGFVTGTASFADNRPR